MMRKCTIHIYILALLVNLLASCDSMLGEESIQAQDKVGIVFTLSMNSAGATSRSLTPDMTTLYENTINEDMFRVLAYTADGKAHEVTIFSMKKISDTTYQISGELQGNYNVGKMVILANCDKGFNPINPLSLLTYSFLGSDFNPGSPRSYIPMWGVKKITTPLVPGKSTDIGTISLLRAMAKIKVTMSAGSLSELTRVAMTQYNNKGACVPSSFESMEETADITETTIPDDITLGSNLAFFQMSDKSYILYLPEYKNRNNQYLAGISVTVQDINGLLHERNVIFGKYNEDGYFTKEYWDILRNHYYAFNLRLEVAADGNLRLDVKTEKYAEFELKPVYGD